MSVAGILGDALAQMPVFPPRPNLGPEPWPPPWASYGPWLTTALAVVWLGSAAWWIYRRDQRRVAEPGYERTMLPNPAHDPLVIWSDRVRNHLDVQLGPGWGRRTTVEIALDPAVTDQLGSDQAEALVAFLKAADRAKFADDPAFELESIATWTEWAAGFVGHSGKRPGSAAGAFLRLMGR